MTAAARRGWLLCLALLAGCAAVPGPQPPLAARDWDVRRAQLAGLTEWVARGKIALHTAQAAESANLRWQQSGDTTHLELSGPLGFAATTVDSDGKYLAIRSGDDYQRWTLQDAAAEARGQWDLPLSSLHHWLKGAPDPGLAVEALEIDPQTHLARHLEQQGWSVEYQAYAPFGGYRLPTRLQVQRNATRARILLSDWQLPPAS